MCFLWDTIGFMMNLLCIYNSRKMFKWIRIRICYVSFIGCHFASGSNLRCCLLHTFKSLNVMEPDYLQTVSSWFHQSLSPRKAGRACYRPHQLKNFNWWGLGRKPSLLLLLPYGTSCTWRQGKPICSWPSGKALRLGYTNLLWGPRMPGNPEMIGGWSTSSAF